MGQSPNFDPVLRTRTLARIVGPYLVIFGAAMAVRAEHLPLILPAFFQDGVLVFVTGAFTLAIGLTLFAAHHHWNSIAAMLITLLGALTTLRGALLLIAPTWVASVASNVVQIPVIASIGGVIAFLVGLWLTALGWLPKSPH